MRPLLVVLALLAIVPFLFGQREEAALVSAAYYTGMAQVQGPLQMDIDLTPPIASPRDSLQLHINLKNLTDSLLTSKIQIHLPSNLQIDSKRLPAGTTINLSSNTMDWLAVIPKNNGLKDLTIPIKVVSADIANPEQQVNISMTYGDINETVSLPIWIGIPPKITRIESPTNVSIGQPLTLNVAAQGPGPLSEVWELGDGRKVSVNNPTTVFPTAGVYDVKVTVNNPIGSDESTTQIAVVPHTTALFHPADDTPGLNEPVKFINSSGGKSPLNYTWYFGDGTSSSETNPQHVYNAPGTYQVRLVSENGFGQSESSHFVTVGTPPLAEILVDNNAPAGELVNGQAVTESGAVEVSWEMGDGRRYQSAKINHVYRQSGDYYVTMTASNEFGSTQVGRWVHVDEGVLKVYMPLVSRYSGLDSGSSADSGTIQPFSPEQVNLEGPFEMEPMDIAPGTTPQQQLLLYINEARSQFDLPPLNEVSTLSSAAQKHSGDMAAAKHTHHAGSDGSFPAERLLWHGYNLGYAGEATAWGFQDPRNSVEFWVNSPSHRPIILNRYATDVGVSYTVDYSAPSVWYWVAEFGNKFSVAEAPILHVQGPASGLEILNSEPITFSWKWPQPLQASEQFTIYLYGPGVNIPVGSVQEPINGMHYGFTFNPLGVAGLHGEFSWQVKLENNRGATITEGALHSVTINLDPSIPTTTPIPSPTATVESQPAIQNSATPTATGVPPIATPRPTESSFPSLVTATPQPTP